MIFISSNLSLIFLGFDSICSFLIIADVNNLSLGKKFLIGDLPFASGVKILSDKNAVVAQIKDNR